MPASRNPHPSGLERLRRPPVETSDWQAWANLMPPLGPHGPRLHVQGTVRLPGRRYRARLEPAPGGPSSAGTLELVVRVSESPPSASGLSRRLWRTLRLEAPYPPGLQAVRVHVEGGEVLTLPVQQVH